MIIKLDIHEKSKANHDKNHLAVPQNVCHNIEFCFFCEYETLVFIFIRLQLILTMIQ
jgi:hypothetical protein